MCPLHSCIDEPTADDIQKTWREEAYASSLQRDEEGIVFKDHRVSHKIMQPYGLN